MTYFDNGLVKSETNPIIRIWFSEESESSTVTVQHCKETKNVETMFQDFLSQYLVFCRFHRQFARSQEVFKKLIVQRFSIFNDDDDDHDDYSCLVAGER